MVKEKISMPVLILVTICLVPSVIIAIFVSVIAGIAFYLGSGIVIVYFQKFMKKMETKKETKRKP